MHKVFAPLARESERDDLGVEIIAIAKKKGEEKMALQMTIKNHQYNILTSVPGYTTAVNVARAMVQKYGPGYRIYAFEGQWLILCRSDKV